MEDKELIKVAVADLKEVIAAIENDEIKTDMIVFNLVNIINDLNGN